MEDRLIFLYHQIALTPMGGHGREGHRAVRCTYKPEGGLQENPQA
jgi:hypothetical protein